jgi:hypothetical protein
MHPKYKPLGTPVTLRRAKLVIELATTKPHPLDAMLTAYQVKLEKARYMRFCEFQRLEFLFLYKTTQFFKKLKYGNL